MPISHEVDQMTSTPMRRRSRTLAPTLPRAYQRDDTRKNKKGRRGAKARARMKRVLATRFGIL